MMCSAPVVRLESEFDAFLFAPLGEDTNGVLLSVLSALVRLDVDPWQEAAKLARLPGKKAAERLASLIASLPEGALVHADAGTIAARLIDLLPGQVSPGPLRSPPASSAAVSKSRGIALCAAVLVFAL